LIVDSGKRGYLRTVCDYVHLNPERARLVRADQALKEYRWSSYPEYLKGPHRRVSWLRVDRLLGELGIPKDSPAGRRQLELHLERRRKEAKPEQWRKLHRGWCYGDEEFRKELLASVHEKHGPSHYGRQKREAAEAKAKRIVDEELKGLGWKTSELMRTAGSELVKVTSAATRLPSDSNASNEINIL
jgi:hypothetical protein